MRNNMYECRYMGFSRLMTQITKKLQWYYNFVKTKCSLSNRLFYGKIDKNRKVKKCYIYYILMMKEA